MREYLLKFFNDFEYEKSDADYLLSIYDKISKNPDALTLFNRGIDEYASNINADFSKIIEDSKTVSTLILEHEYTVNLLTLLCMTKHLQKHYKEKNYPYELYYESALDLKYKLDECKVVKGKVGTFVPNWFSRLFAMTLFALGRLQFEIKLFGKEYSKNGVTLTPESEVLNVHIPRSKKPLTEDVCLQSFNMAREFFKTRFGENPAFVCHSWLLYPETLKLYKETSNTYKFAKLFNVIETGIRTHDEDLWRLFDTDEKNPDRLPNDTSIRRAFISHLKTGGRTGWAYGVFFFSELSY